MQPSSVRGVAGACEPTISFFGKQLPLRRVAGELMFLLDPKDLTRAVVPDLYVMEDEPQGGPKLPSWKFWEHEGKVPTLVLEVVSDAYTKDYAPEEIPARYQELGVKEVVRYDPDFSGHRQGEYERRLLSHFVLDAEGQMIEVPVEGKVLKLRSYPLWFLHRPPYYLRVATGENQDSLTLWPTDAEQAEQMMTLLRAQAERANAEAEQRMQAEAEIARLRAELARYRSQDQDQDQDR